MKCKTTCCGSTIVIIHLIVLMVLPPPSLSQSSPCPDIFSYQIDRATGQVFGYVQVRNIQAGQTAKLIVNLFITARLPPNNVGSINLIKSEDATFNDIVRGQPAQYRINFPLQNILPTLVSITLNGYTICSGYQPSRNVPHTAIFLEHTLCTVLGSTNDLYSRCRVGNGNTVYNPPQPGVVNRYPVENTPVIYIEPDNRFNTEVQVFPPIQRRTTTTTTTTTTTQRPQTERSWQPQPRPSWSIEPTRLPSPHELPPYPRVVQRRPQVARLEPISPAARPTTKAPTTAPRTTFQPPNGYPCGKISNAFFNRLAINGNLANRGQFPWIAPLFDRTYPQNPKYICGSTIITNRYLITAAHCVYDLDEVFTSQRIVAVPGMYNVDNFFDDNALIADIVQIIPHEDYIADDDTNDADVALLRMKTALTFTDYIIPICTWQGDNDIGRLVGQEGIVAGWGLTETGSTSVPMFVKATIVDRKQCNAHLQRNYQSHARVFCGDGHGSVPCNGDSGSGMVIKRGNQFYLRGVVSKGLVDPNTYKCDPKRYSVYIDVALFRFWLREVTQN